MSKKQVVPKNRRKKIEFLFNAPPFAEAVFLAGDFNDWNGKKHCMKKGRIGVWEKTLMLSPGTYEYKYIVDGNWQEGVSISEKRMNSFGTYNNLIVIPD